MLANQLSNVLTILGINQEDEKKVEVVTLLFNMVESAISLRVGEPQVPKALEWLSNEIVIRRYQLLGAEHLQSETIDVIASTFKRGDILAEYTEYIDSYINNIQAKSEEGKIVSKKRLRML